MKEIAFLDGGIRLHWNRRGIPLFRLDTLDPNTRTGVGGEVPFSAATPLLADRKLDFERKRHLQK
jgi:hypothetical protein